MPPPASGGALGSPRTGGAYGGSPHSAMPLSWEVQGGLPSETEALAQQAYGKWLAPQGGGGSPSSGAIEQKLSALSRRTAAEMRRAEKERGDHDRRLEVLEELCRQHLGSLDVRFGQAREEAAAEVEKAMQRVRQRFERDFKEVSEALEEYNSKASSSHELTADTVRSLQKRSDANQSGLEELRVWRREVEQQLAVGAGGSSSGGDGGGGWAVAAAPLARRGESNMEDRVDDRMEAALVRERKQAHERLRSSCAEMTGHLNDLRRELVEQRRIADLAASRAEDRRERTQQELTAQIGDLETQIAELGGALATRLQAKVTSVTNSMSRQLEEQVQETRRDFEQRLSPLEERTTALESAAESSEQWISNQVQLWRRENAELHNGLTSLQGPIQRREYDRILEAAREEARTVHLEVMSIDTRVAAIEERLADDPGRRRHDALGRIGGSRE